MSQSALRASLSVALPYLIFAALWIVYSDQGVTMLAGDVSEATELQTAKGIVFVIASAALIFGLVHARHLRLNRHHAAQIKAERDLAGVLETVSDGVWTVDVATRGVSWGGHWASLTGYAVDALPTVAEWLGALHPDDRTAFGRALEGLLDGSVPHLVHEHRIRAADGTWLWMRAQGRPVPPVEPDAPEMDVGPRVIGTYTDLTAGHRQEQRLSALAHDLGVARADLDDLTSAAAHDLRQPVREVVSYAQLLERRLGSDLSAEARADIGFLSAAAHHLQGLLDGLMRAVEASRAMVTFAPVPLEPLVAACVAHYRTDLEAAGGVVQIDTLPTVAGDGGQLALVFEALLSNAIKFRSPERPLRIVVRAEQSGAWWRIIVADNGIGLPAEYAEQIFQAFRRLHNRGEYDGAGMGLAICRSIAVHHGGAIRAEGAPDAGARLVLSLPARDVAEDDAGRGTAAETDAAETGTPGRDATGRLKD